MRTIFHRTLALIILVSATLNGQSNDEARKAYMKEANLIFDTALESGRAYEMLRELTKTIGHRLSGSPQAAAAIEWARLTMIDAGLENVHLQKVMVPRWVRGPVEQARIINSPSIGTEELSVCALGRSIGTPEQGITAEVIEVHDFDQVRALGNRAKGKIIFYNRPFSRKERNTFSGYRGAVDQRSLGAVEAAKVGAVAVLVRSMTPNLDDVPHTGALRYQDGVKKIPAAAISTMDAEMLSSVLKNDGSVRVTLRLSAKTLPDVMSYNVIGELKGTDIPDEVVLLGGHLDSWDKGEGAHDDGSGCVQSIEALRLLKELGLRPKRTLRAVMFINEENGLRGGRTYADSVAASGPKHIVAIESDRGGFMPVGFTVSADGDRLRSVARWSYLFSQIGADRIRKGGGGADIGPLGRLGTLTIGLLPESQRYFTYHHTDLDVFEAVDRRELELGAASMAILAYVLANEGVR
ncbi:MAG TPA: peptidase M28 family protein [Bacteroidetes bacterium]|nr:peptidase M28 family protein [Bacteroidota bacterium]